MQNIPYPYMRTPMTTILLSLLEYPTIITTATATAKATTTII